MYTHVVALLLATCFTAPALADEVTCWAPDGETRADNDTYVPCNKLGIEHEGAVSSCCQLDGDPDERDLCTLNGLCLRDGVLTRGYCTDKTWNSPACVNVCGNDEDGGSSNGTIEITACGDGTYCCGFNKITCCDTDKAFSLPAQASVTDSNATNADSASASTYKNATIGVSVVLGVVVVAAAGVIFWLMKKNKALGKQLLEDRQLEITPVSPDPQQYASLPVPPTSPGMSTYSHSKQPSVALGSPHFSEVHSTQRYSELEAYQDRPLASPEFPNTQETPVRESPIIPSRM